MKEIRYILLFLLLPSLFIACNDETEPGIPGEARPTMNPQDSLVMVAYYHSMKCAEWKGGFHWDLEDYTTWGGVKAALDTIKNEYRIVEIEVPMAETYLPDGYSLPAELGNLPYLRSIIVWGDGRAAGGIPPEIFNCPLEVFYLMGRANGEERKGFSGTIPKEIGKVAKTLKHLKIALTNIGGEIPEEIAQLQNLKTPVYFYNNEFTGKVPIMFRELPVVTSLDNNNYTEMDWRYFTEDVGYVPTLYHNCLSGDIPEEVLSTQRWENYKWHLTAQKMGYGYEGKFFE